MSTAATRGMIVVTGSTGLQGGAVTRQLLRDGWQVRALTRKPSGTRARALAALGAEIVQADMDVPESLQGACVGADGVYSVQNPFTSGPEAEVRHGRNVADAAHAAGVRHVVYGSAGIGKPGTGIPSWETKLQIEDHMQRLQLPLTILRPMAFMELMTERKFFPAASTWHVMPALMGDTRDVGWLCTDDLGTIAAHVFAAPAQFIGADLSLASDVQSLEQCRAIYHEVMGRKPPHLPLPVWLFKRFGFVGKDLTTMWSWLRTATIPLDTAPTRAIHPQALTVRDWLSTRTGAAAGNDAR